ncbi:MAG: arginyl-tRNA synthetase [Methanosaeta sp. ASP1-1]|nr:arginine--tRNA ligase [Methanothrix sp.]MDD1734096.1 arginine--tRNA ligase [Methanothrix sp.]MDD1739837.1 arginine--tRNA ligase [Methanothrix sp.]OYV08406.1 MAG: arginyl-tRNA synthetase [Methanosaeta sp. ASP1-1]OYV14633.1 MAG: arginyl-tRNA synthetase [Methanosaeta sp. NSM2]
MFLDFMSEVEALLKSALERCGCNLEDGANPLGLDISPHADLASSVAFRLAPSLKKSPAAIAVEIHQALPEDRRYVDRVEVLGPYLNFFVNQKFLDKVLKEALADDAWTGRMNEKVIVEHTSANPDGPLHVGHIRNSVIGDSLVRILRRAGCSVDAQYYINDMGRQEAMVVVGCDHFQIDGSKADHAVAKVYIAANKLMETEPAIRDEADSVIARYEAGDKEIAAKIQSAVKYALGGIEQTLRRMNIRHDSYHWESEFVRKGDVEEIVGLLEKTGLTEWEEGAFQLDLTSHGFEKKMVLKRANGTSLYITRDLAYHRWKSENSDRSVDILGADHKLVSGQLRTALRLLGVREPEVVIFEFVSLPTGSMSTRKGKFISADELLDEVEKQAYEEVRLRRPEESEAFLRKVAAQVAAGAVRYDVVKVSADKATTFDWKQALDFEKLSAPFIQYSHARAASILRRGEAELKAEDVSALRSDLLAGEYEIALLKKIAQFDLVIDRAARELKPHQLATYARELAESFNLFYRYSPVLDAEPDLRQARMALARAAKNALWVTLDTLGIAALETM